MKDEIVERVLDDSPDSPHTDESLRTQLRTASAGTWIVLALWGALAVGEFLNGEPVFGTLFILVGLTHAYTTLRTETASEQESLVTDEGLTPLFWSRIAFLGVLVVVTVYAFFAREPGFIILLLAAIHVAIITIPEPWLFGERDNGRLSKWAEYIEDQRVFQLIERYWFQILIVLALAVFVVATEML